MGFAGNSHIISFSLKYKVYLFQRSNCVEHPWRDDRDLWVPDKFSVFADPSLAEC